MNKFYNYGISCWLIFCAVLSTNLKAQPDSQVTKDSTVQFNTSPNEKNLTELEKIIVTEKKEIHLAPSERFHIPASSPGVEVLSKKDLEEMNPSDIYNVFERALGMNIARQGSRIHNWVQGRGGEKSALGIILDGVYMPATEAQRILGDLPIELIQSIKIVRDASIATMGPLMSPGSNSATSPNQGFIMIETKRTKDEHRIGEATLGYGTYNAFKVNSFYGQSFGDTGRFSFGYNKSRNDSRKDRFGDWNNAFDANTFLFNGGFSLWRITADMSVYYTQASREVQRYQENQINKNAFRAAVWQYDPINTRMLSLALTGRWNENHTTQFWGGYTDAIGTAYYDQINISTGVKTKDTLPKESKDAAKEFNLLHTWSSNGDNTKNSLKGGIQTVLWSQLTETDALTIRYPKEENIYGFYLSDELTITDRFVLDLGGRLDKQYIIKGGSLRTSKGKTILAENDVWGSDAYSVSLGCAFDFTKEYGISARVGFNNTPTPKGMITTNDKIIDPELRMKYEFGVAADPFKYLQFNATGYFYDINNAKIQISTLRLPSELIASDSVDMPVFGANDRMSRYGVEMSLQGRNIGPLGYKAGFTLMGCSDTIQDKSNPRYKLSLGLNFAHKGFAASFDFLLVPEYQVYSTQTKKYYPVGDYKVLNPSLNYSFNKHLRLRLYGKNITDEKYSTNYKTFPGNDTGYFYDLGAVYGAEITLNL